MLHKVRTKSGMRNRTIYVFLKMNMFLFKVMFFPILDTKTDDCFLKHFIFWFSFCAYYLLALKKWSENTQLSTFYSFVEFIVWQKWKKTGQCNVCYILCWRKNDLILKISQWMCWGWMLKWMKKIYYRY